MALNPRSETDPSVEKTRNMLFCVEMRGVGKADPHIAGLINPPSGDEPLYACKRREYINMSCCQTVYSSSSAVLSVNVMSI